MVESPVFLDRLRSFLSLTERLEFSMISDICNYGKPCFGLTLGMGQSCMTPVRTIGEEAALIDTEKQENEA